MDRISNKNHTRIFNLIYIVFVFSLVYVIGLGIDLELNIPLQFFMVLLGSSAVKFFLINPLIFYGLLVTGFIGALLINRFITPFLFLFIERGYFLFDNIINNLQGRENITSDNVLLFWGILIVLVSFFTAFILFKNKSIYLLLPVYISLFLYYWYTFFNEAYWMISIFLLAFFILMGLDNSSREEIDTPWLQTVTVYSLLIVFIALLLPKSNNYIEWPWLHQKIYSRFPIVESLRSYNSSNRGSLEASLFNFSITGFQTEPSRLGGPVILNDRKIMTVYADNSSYLRGNVRHVYTGNSWETIKEPWESYRLKQDFSGLSKEEKGLYYEEVDITITNHSFASTTLFSPYKPTEVYFTDNYNIRVNRDDALLFPQGIYNNENYLIRVQRPLPYGILMSLGIDQKKEDIDRLDIYLQTPDDRITERTKALVKEIVKDATNDFEKAVAIENYLRNNYKYNLNVNEVPENLEFVDYFLFEEQEGYCTYYATSMALMLRLEGIPSRYIEGYLAHDLVEKDIYEVKQENAHAWVEAFIEPVGWMTFEPTPAYSIDPRFDDHEPSILDEGVIQGITDVNNMNLRSDIEGPIMESDQDFLGGGGNPNYENSSQNMPVTFSKNIVIFIIGIFILILPVKFLIGFFQHKFKESQVKKLSNKKRIIYLYKQILSIMEFLGYPQNYGETHFDYANRVAYKFFNFNDKGIQEITEIFVKSKYSNSPTLDQDVLDLEIYRKTLENRLKNHWGSKTYYYRKYVKIGFIKN